MITHEDGNYALFRRAVVDRDAAAWASVHERYRSLLIAWAARSQARTDQILDCAAIADQAFARMWMALTPERFAHFPSVARLLGYLRTCVRTAIIDNLRQQTTGWQDLPTTYFEKDSMPEQIVLAEMERAALWRLVRQTAVTQAEWIALVESYAYNLPPRVIHVRHPELFGSVVEVYTAKRNLINRLQGNRKLQCLYAEHLRV